MSENELSEFLQGVFTAYVEKHKPQEVRAEVEAKLAEARQVVATLEEQLTASGATDDELKEFLISTNKLLGGFTTEAALMTMLVTRFGGAEEAPKKKRATRKKKEEPPITDDEKQLIKDVMTEEQMSCREIAQQVSQFSGDEWLPADVSPILKACIEDHSVVTEGKGQGKRYMLAKPSDAPPVEPAVETPVAAAPAPVAPPAAAPAPLAPPPIPPPQG